MGRNYRCWIVGGLRARAPVKCLCFPPCLPSKDLHILTHYGVLWSWSAWLPQPAITLIASKKLKSFKAFGLTAEGKCMFVSLRLPPFLTPSLFLQLRLCEGSDSVALPSIYNSTFCRVREKSVWRRRGLVVCHSSCDIFFQSHTRVVASNGCSFTAACTLSIHYKLCFCFCAVFSSHTHIVWLTTFSLTASLVYLSGSIVHKSSLEVRCVFVCVNVCVP